MKFLHRLNLVLFCLLHFCVLLVFGYTIVRVGAAWHSSNIGNSEMAYFLFCFFVPVVFLLFKFLGITTKADNTSVYLLLVIIALLSVLIYIGALIWLIVDCFKNNEWESYEFLIVLIFLVVSIVLLVGVWQKKI
jgi:hypothetical protein